MDSVWLLWFEQEREVGEDTELLIGVYRSEAAPKPPSNESRIRLVFEITLRDSKPTSISSIRTIG